jgi:1-acyl-sn-glycerol-3-phosphate acyltransferase
MAPLWAGMCRGSRWHRWPLVLGVCLIRAFYALGQTLLQFACMALLGLVCLAWMPLACVGGWVLPRKQAGQLGRAFVSICFRNYFRLLSALGLCRFDLTALDALRGESVILAPNHPCLLDAPLVFSRLSNVSCIMKASLMDQLLLGAGSRLAGYIRNDSPRRMVKAAACALASGQHLLLFPEGTRTTRLPVNPFVPSIGLIARRAQKPVQTLLIETDSLFLSKGWPWYRRPAFPIHYRVSLGRRFSCDTESLESQLQAYFCQALSTRTPLPLEPSHDANQS